MGFFLYLPPLMYYLTIFDYLPLPLWVTLPDVYRVCLRKCSRSGIFSNHSGAYYCTSSLVLNPIVGGSCCTPKHYSRHSSCFPEGWIPSIAHDVRATGSDRTLLRSEGGSTCGTKRRERGGLRAVRHTRHCAGVGHAHPLRGCALWEGRPYFHLVHFHDPPLRQP